MISLHAKLRIDRLGDKGEGIAAGPDGQIFVPYALPGETIVAEVDGKDGKLVEILSASDQRVAASCPYFSICGGCAVQTAPPDAYRRWKEERITRALRHAGLAAEVAPLADAHGEGRMRATFHVRYDPNGKPCVGFMQARSHQIVEIDACPLLASSMAEALPAARSLAKALAESRKPLDILVTATASGLDLDMKGHGPIDDRQRRMLADLAMRLDLARLSNHGEPIITQRIPRLAMGRTMVTLPPGSFLQATRAGADLLTAKINAALLGARRIADLFAGLGTFTLPLAEFGQVHAVDLEPEALAALAKAARGADLRPVSIEMRDLFRRPLDPREASAFDAILFDPPRAGAMQQALALAKSSVPRVVAVSCNPQSFARDAAILCSGGYELARVEPIDQFRFSPHIELVATFVRPQIKTRRPRRLLG